MVTFGLNHIAHVASGLSAAVYHPVRTKTVAPVLLSLFGFTPVQAELLIGGFLMVLQSITLVAYRAKSYLPVRISGLR
jgi:hypothetical protein